MILQTGGRALGATSTRSSPSSRARRRASAVDVEPILLSSWSIRKTGEILICSLWRKLVEMAVHSCVINRCRTRARASANFGKPLTSDPRQIAALAELGKRKTRVPGFAAPPIGFQGKDLRRWEGLCLASPVQRPAVHHQEKDRIFRPQLPIVRAVAPIIGRPSGIIMRVRV